ncbi:MAG: glycosyltransferase family 2 protein [Candidatus Nitrosocaldus sp.]
MMGVEVKGLKDRLKALDVNRLVTVVIPTLNEEQGIAKVIEELHSLGITNILVVDGYSSDRTVDVARSLGARVIYQHGKGKTGALKAAVEHVSTPYMLVMDGDYTYDASSIERFLQHMDNYDEIIGARVPVDDASMSRLHKFGNAVITKVFNLLINTNLSDVCSGMYMLKTDTMKEIDLNTSGFDVEAEIAAQIASIGNITEVPINYRARIGRQKLSTWKHGFRIISSIFNLAKVHNPGAFYSLLVSLLLIPAGIIFFNSFVEMMYTGKFSSNWFLVGVALLLVAIQGMSIGVLSLVVKRSQMRLIRMMKRQIGKVYT